MSEIFPEALVKAEFAVIDEFQVTLEDLRSMSHMSSRRRECVEARWAVWTYAFDVLGYTYSRIARLYQKDHTTIIHGVDKGRTKGLGKRAERTIKAKYPNL